MSTAPFTPASPDWENGVRLDACPSWCDGVHGTFVNDEYQDGRLVGGDAIHTSAGTVIRDESARVAGDGDVLYVEQYPAWPGGPNEEYIVCGDARFTPASARLAAAELNRLADLLEANR